jgi:tRNA-dihydrouridine synthase
MTNYPFAKTKPFFVLAPMDDVTDTVFRRIVKEISSPDVFFTEFVNVDGLQSPGRSKLLKKLRFTNLDTPLIAQLWGKNPDNFYKTAKQIADGSLSKELGNAPGVNFCGVDLNMGCPQKKEVGSGTCAALINDRPLAKLIIEATKNGLDGKLPLSVKTRTGFNEVDVSWIEFILNQNINMLTIHGRTRKQKSSVDANWDHIGEARVIRDKISPSTLIVGNGDVLSRDQGIELSKKYKLDGIMIGRGIFHDPFVFAEHSNWLNFPAEKRINLYKKHVELFSETWQNGERPIHTLNKFCKVYINGFDGAKELREKLMNCSNSSQLIEVMNSYFKLSIL